MTDSCFCRPYGRVDFHIKLPMRPLIWVIGSFSLHRERGLAFAEYPVRVSIYIKQLFLTLYVCLFVCLFPRISVSFACVGLKLCRRALGPIVLVKICCVICVKRSPNAETLKLAVGHDFWSVTFLLPLALTYQYMTG